MSSTLGDVCNAEPWSRAQASATWRSLKQAIEQIQHHNSGTLSFEELYRNAYNLTLYKYGEMLYNGVSNCVRVHLQNQTMSILNAPDDRLLRCLLDCWQEHQLVSNLLRDIFMYLDRNFVQPNKRLTVYEMSIHLFKEEIIDVENIAARVSRVLVKNIDADRQGTYMHIDRDEVKGFNCMLSSIDMVTTKSLLTTPPTAGRKHDEERETRVAAYTSTHSAYKRLFERPLVNTTTQFYKNISQEALADLTVPEYLLKAEECLRQERERVMSYMADSTLEPLMDVVEQELIKNHASQLILSDRGGARDMFVGGQTENMGRLFSLICHYLPARAELLELMKATIISAGEEILGDAARPSECSEFMENLFDLKQKYDSFGQFSFNGDKQFQQCAKSAFEQFLNVHTRAAQHMALYIDELFRKHMRDLNEAEVEHRMDLVASVFRFLQDKDVFESFYKQHLARRLLHNRTCRETERIMTQKLKSECGQAYTAKLDGMLKDMVASEKFMQGYREYRAQQNTSQVVELGARVLQNGNWPADKPPMKCVLPADLSSEVAMFEAHYMSLHNSRILIWQFDKGSAEVRWAKSPTTRYELNVSTFQMLILYMFNSYETLSYKTIKDEARIPEDELPRHLISLYSSPKARILIRSAAEGGKVGRELKETDIFKVNDEFQSVSYKVNVPLIVSGSRGTEAPRDVTQIVNSAVPPTVEQDRQHLIEANIVRIMKARKTLSHNDLVMGVTNGLISRFTPCPQLIKQRIEKLIEREYLERDKNDRRVYRYLA